MLARCEPPLAGVIKFPLSWRGDKTLDIIDLI